MDDSRSLDETEFAAFVTARQRTTSLGVLCLRYLILSDLFLSYLTSPNLTGSNVILPSLILLNFIPSNLVQRNSDSIPSLILVYFLLIYPCSIQVKWPRRREVGPGQGQKDDPELLGEHSPHI